MTALRLLAGAILLLLPGVALAQQQGPAEYVLHLKPEVAVEMLKGMQLLPYGEVRAAINEVQQQIMMQQQQANEPPKPAEPPK